MEPTTSYSNIEMRVVKRDGSLEEISFDKILNRIKNIGQMSNIQINYSSLTMKVIDQLYDKIPTTKIDELTAEQCASLSTIHPDYGILAGNIIMSNHQKNTNASFYQVVEELACFRDANGVLSPLVSEELLAVVCQYRNEIETMMDYQRDFLIDYFGFKTLERSYLFRVNDTVVERVQHMWMRVSIGIHGANLPAVKETYDMMSLKYFTHATPTLFNAGTPHPQLSSCYLIAMEDDSLEGIFDTLKDCAKISKWAGGIGLHIHDIRANNSLIRGTNGKSSGLPPMLKVFNDTARFINQGGKRNGSFAIYLEPWHADVYEYLDLKKNHGDEEMRARDLFYALWVCDLFMKRVKDNDTWSLFCPNECPGLADVYGDEFEDLYTRYERENRERKKVNARDLWFKILDSQMETGTPYLLYKDACNKKSNQKNLGTIKSSNLCVAPETKILTENGFIEIKSLHGEKIKIWNGEEFSEVTIHKTGENQELLEVETSDGCILHCTPYHKFFVQNAYFTSKSKEKNDLKIEIVEAKDLKEGDRLIKCDFPVIDGDKHMKYAYTHGVFCGDGTYNNNHETKKNCKFKSLNKHSYCKRHLDYESYNKNDLLVQTEETNYMCNAMSYEKKPILTLYGCKKELLSFLNYRSVGNIDLQGRINVSLPVDIEEKFYVPMDCTLKDKMDWFSGYTDADGCICRNGENQQLQVGSIDKDFLFQVKLMLQTCGIYPKMKKIKDEHKELLPDSNREYKEYICKSFYRLLINSCDLQKLLEIGYSPKRLKIVRNTPNRNARQFVKIKKVTFTGRKDDTYCFHEPKKNTGIFNGMITSQCSEIVEYSDDKETAVCNLASVALPSFVNEETKTFDYDKLHSVVKVMTSNLNRVIDVNFYPTEKTERSNKLHRPIGIGVQGLADAFILMDLAFHSEEAREVNKMIFETIYHASLERSNELAEERYRQISPSLSLLAKSEPDLPERIRSLYGNRLYEIVQPIVYYADKSERNKSDIDDDGIRYFNEDYHYAELLSFFEEKNHTLCGAYSTFAGSPAHQGKLQFDLWSENALATGGEALTNVVTDRYDWDALKTKIVKYGLRNSLLVAPMPTASTSQILGNNECFEPLTSNIYSRRTLAGEFVLANKYLMKELIQLGLWNERLKNNIIENKGSIQQLTIIPEAIRNKYKIVWEMPMKHLIDMSADRGLYVCQSQSLNLWLEDPTYNSLTSMHFYAWKKGLKTGVYYLRRKAKHQAQQFTVEPETDHLHNKTNQSIQEEEEVGCEMCSA